MLIFASDARAESATPAPAVLWYRSSEGCPDGASFLESVGERASLLRLADVGDHVDFVVNLALTNEGARGRLERETERGTVAIREVEDESCERVAEVVALNLSLALDPAALARPVADEQAEPEPDNLHHSADSASADSTSDFVEFTDEKGSSEPATGPETPVLASQSSSGEERAPRGAAPQAAEAGDEEPRSESSLRFRIGVQAGAHGGVATDLLTRAALFVEAHDLISWVPDLTLRVGAVGARGSSGTSLGAIENGYWAGRVELCPISLGGEVVSARPCGAFELGHLWVSGPSSDSALWGALGAHVRGTWDISGRFALEADVGAHVPLRTYEVVAGPDVLYRSAPIGISAVLGVSFAF